MILTAIINLLMMVSFQRWFQFPQKICFPATKICHRRLQLMAMRQVLSNKVIGMSRHRACPKFDLMLLGMGPDGHVASLFPWLHQRYEKLGGVSGFRQGLTKTTSIKDHHGISSDKLDRLQKSPLLSQGKMWIMQ